MKNVLIILTSYRQGGICRSLQNWLNLHDPEEYSIDVCVLDDYGPYKNKFKNCRILQNSYILNCLYGHFSDMKGIKKILTFILKSIGKVCPRFKTYISKLEIRRISKGYDTVIGFGEGLPTILASWTDVSNRISWIHCDYSNYKKINGNIDETYIYKNIDKTVCVSQFTSNNFKKELPNYQGEVHTIYNILDTELMKLMSQDTNFDSRFLTDKITLITVGRLDPVKNITIIPKIAKKLIDKGLDFRWFIIGPIGIESEYSNLIFNIEKYELKENVIYLGAKENPYQYIIRSHVLINTSFSEACPYVINEAKVLGIPVVCNDFGSAEEFVENESSGYITQLNNMDNVLDYLINHEEIINKIKLRLKDFKFNNNNILEKIYSII